MERTPFVVSGEVGVWDDVLEYVRGRIPDVEFRTWFGQVRPLGIEDGTLMIGVPTTFAREWLKNNYGSILEEALGDLGASAPRVGFQVVQFQKTEQQGMFGDGSGSGSGAAHLPEPPKRQPPKPALRS